MKIRFKPAIKSVVKFVSKHRNTLIIAASSAASVTSTVLAVKATPKAMAHIQQKKEELGINELSKKQIVQACWKDYIPAGIVGAAGLVGTGVAVAGFEGAVSAATTAATKATELCNEQTKALENVLGTEKAAEITTQAAQKVEEKHNPSTYLCDIPTPGGEELFVDAYSGRVFRSSKTWIKDCMIDFNNDLIDGSPEPLVLNDWYQLLAPNVDQRALHTDIGDQLGATCKDSQRATKLSVIFEDSHTVDGRPAYRFRFDRPLELVYHY